MEEPVQQKITVLVAHFRSDIVSGAEYAIADMLEKCDHRFHFVMLTPGDGNLAQYYRSRGFEVWSKKVETPRRKYPGLHTIQSYFLARRLRSAGIDMVIANTFPATSRIESACRMAGIPHAIYVREYIRDVSLHRAILGRAFRIFAVSGDVAAYLAPMCEASKIVVTYDHLQVEPIMSRLSASETVRVVLPFSENHPLIGIVGRITTYKQQCLFIKAIPPVLKHVPSARFVVVGSAVQQEKNYENSLKKLAIDLGISDYVAFLGHRTDALEIIAKLTVCCLTSDREPFPRTVLEAQLIGCPVVASNSGGCPEMVEDGVTGLLFSAIAPDAPKQLSEAILQFLNNATLRKKIAVSARKQVLNTVATKLPIIKFEREIQKIFTNR